MLRLRSLININNKIWLDIETDRKADREYVSNVFLRWNYNVLMGEKDEITLDEINTQSETAAIKAHEALWSRWNING